MNFYHPKKPRPFISPVHSRIAQERNDFYEQFLINDIFIESVLRGVSKLYTLERILQIREPLLYQRYKSMMSWKGPRLDKAEREIFYALELSSKGLCRISPYEKEYLSEF